MVNWFQFTICDHKNRKKNNMENIFISKTKKLKQDYTFTPTEMQYILESYNENNRPSSESRIQDLEYCIKTNQWMENTGNPITFDSDGNLVSGQHRFRAHINQEKSLVADVIYGLDPKVRLHTDDQWPRSAAILTLTANGEEVNKENKSRRTQEFAIARLLKRDEGGFIKSRRICPEELQTLINEKKVYFSKILDFIDPESRRVSIRAACVKYIEKDPIKGEDFMVGVLSKIEKVGSNLPPGSPIAWAKKIIGKSCSGGSAIDKEYQRLVYSIHKHYRGETQTGTGLLGNPNLPKWEF